jgi:hypothetical protein
MDKARNAPVSSEPDLNEVSKYIQQARATVDLIMQCADSKTVLPGANDETLQNSLWAVMDQLELAQQVLNGKEVPHD